MSLPTSPLQPRAMLGTLSSRPPQTANVPVYLRVLVHPSIAVFVALAPPILAAVGSSTSSTLAAIVPHIAHAVLLVLTGVYLYLIVQVPWDLYQVAARRADALALLESTQNSEPSNVAHPTTPKSKPASHSASASSSSAAASCTIYATLTLHPPDGPARWLARGAFVMSLASPIVGSALLLAVKARLRDAWWIPLDLLDPVPFALAASIRPLLQLAASAARAASVPPPSIDETREAMGAGENLLGAGPAAAAARSSVHISSSNWPHHHHHHHRDVHAHAHLDRTARFSCDADVPDTSQSPIPAAWLPHLDPSASAFVDSMPPDLPPSWMSSDPSLASLSPKSIHTQLTALRTHLALHLRHLDAALVASPSSPSSNNLSSLSSRPSSFSTLITSFLRSPTSWLSTHLPRPSLPLISYLPPAPPIRTWLTWLFLGWLRWIVACVVLPLVAWISMVRATWWVLTLVPKQVIRHAIEAPPALSATPPLEARRRRRGSVPANDELAAEAPMPATSVPLDEKDSGGSTSVVEDTASLVDALLSRVLPAGMYSTTPPHVHSKQRHTSPAPARSSSKGAAVTAASRSRTRSRGARGSQLRPLSAPVAGAAAGDLHSVKRPTTVAVQ